MESRGKRKAKVVEVFTLVGIEVDTTNHFQANKVFQNKEVVVDYARKSGCRHGIVVVVKRSDLNDPNRTPRILFGCERNDGYRGRDNVKRKTSTKKCGCPFSMKAHVVDTLTGTWKLVVLNGKHNHALVRTFEGHSYVGRLNKEEKETVERLSKSGVKTRDILNHIKLKDPTNASTMKTVYNARIVLRIHETEGYVTRHRFEETIEVVKDLFWCSSTSIQLARAFPFVFMLDCTYKTNKYRLPLLQIVGVTSTNKTFSVAFCYMNVEKEENYVWALGYFRDLFDGVLADVFICDRDIALMNAVKVVFPAAKNMLCRVHISRNVLSNCVSLFRLKTEFDNFIVGWAWVDQYFHLGNTSTNRVESSHAKLKKYLSNSVGGFVQSFNKIVKESSKLVSSVNVFYANITLYDMVPDKIVPNIYVVDIKASFEDSLTRVPIRFRIPLYKDLVNMVSTAALEKIEIELASIGSNGLSAVDCNHRCLKAFGLPCGHMLTQYRAEGRSIPLNDVHNYWKQLCIKPYSEDLKDEISIEVEIEIVRRMFAAATVHQKYEIKRPLQLVGQPSSTTLMEPKAKVNLRGRKKGQRGHKDFDKSTKCDPSTFEYAQEGHVLDDVGQSQASQSQSLNEGWWHLSLDGRMMIGELLGKTLPMSCTEMAVRNNWMVMPYMGNVISTCYNVVVVLVSQKQRLTFFPLRDPIPVECNHGVMVFGYINDSHFVRMELAADNPLSPV
ncbi:uncharacterized protein LOC119999120 [Tripterygium wilfordii]|uniref:uncharacterized protein LOC119999120 n=1 Tax=Tripterygium wilfordii TaxID=458696 RepID=UPI0018F84C12|nr:uncharacterized protein LOC119999120 [Tripterygium wilfordii]